MTRGRVLLALTLLLAAIASVHAQGHISFGHGATAPGGLAGWLMERQSAFYRELVKAVRATGSDRGALAVLLGLSFFYGIFHAAGPGHGKAVIASYLFASAASWRRGVVLASVSSLAQGLVAIAVVSLGAVLMGATAKRMSGAVWIIETASYLLIVAIGARLIWTKGRSFLCAIGADWSFIMDTRAVARTESGAVAARGATVMAGPSPCMTMGGLRIGARAIGDCCGHAKAFEAAAVNGPDGWRRGAAVITAVGLRPCSGAILVLVFALTQGVLMTGVYAVLAMATGTAITVAAIASFAVIGRTSASRITAAREGAGTLVLRGLEVLAAASVVLFGLLLLSGYMATERLMVM